MLSFDVFWVVDQQYILTILTILTIDVIFLEKSKGRSAYQIFNNRM